MRVHFPVLHLLEITADAGNDILTASKHKLQNKKLKKDGEKKEMKTKKRDFSVCYSCTLVHTGNTISKAQDVKKNTTTKQITAFPMTGKHSPAHSRGP